VYFPLVVIPDPRTRPWEDRFDGEQITHLPGLEDSAPRIDERNALALELEAGAEIASSQIPTQFR
jgi:hypothetical protein